MGGGPRRRSDSVGDQRSEPRLDLPPGCNYTTYPLDLPATETDQWNISYQRQIARDWMVSANYLGNVVRNVWTTNQMNPAVFAPGATPANTNQRRQLFLQNPATGQYYASIQELDPNGTSNYHGLLLSMQRRRADGFSLQANYTISRCITDRWNQEPGVSGSPYMIPGDREADRGKCPNSPEHSLNASVVYLIPSAGSGVAAAITGGWQLSAIVSARSGSYFTVTTGVDNALSGQPNQRANQVLDDPFMPNRTFSQWLNPVAFQAPASGTYGTMPLDAIQGPGRWNIDMGLSRSFRTGANSQVQLRWEVFNVLNTVNPDNPVSTLSSFDFGQITALAGGTAPRIMQLAVKYPFLTLLIRQPNSAYSALNDVAACAHGGGARARRTVISARAGLHCIEPGARKWQLLRENVATLVDSPRNVARAIQPLTSRNGSSGAADVLQNGAVGMPLRRRLASANS